MIRISDYWYLAVFGRQPEGPYQEKDIVKSLKEGKLSWAIFACNPAIDLPWTRLMDIAHLKEHLPQAPTLNLYQELLSDFKGRSQTSTNTSIGEDKWFLQCNGSQFGPMTVDEIKLLMKQMSKQKMYAWKQGLQGWVDTSTIPELKSQSDKTKKSSSSDPNNRRKSKRVKLLASVTISVEDDRIDDIQGICRDISTGGLFIVTQDTLPLNTAINIQVSPVSNMTVKPFAAKGIIVSVGREETGMAIQFTQLSSTTKAELELYTQTTD